jgi:hypothetical protein
MQLLDVDGELHLRVDAALYDEVARLLQGQRRLFARLLVAGVEREPIGFNEEGVVDRAVVTVDELMVSPRCRNRSEGS